MQANYLPSDDFITVRQAAGLMRRSTAWVRDQAVCGRIACRRDTVLLVSLADVIKLSRRGARRRPRLRLIVDNTRN